MCLSVSRTRLLQQHIITYYSLCINYADKTNKIKAECIYYDYCLKFFNNNSSLCMLSTFKFWATGTILGYHFKAFVNH